MPERADEPQFDSTKIVGGPMMLAAVKLLQRTGAQTYRVGFSDEDDGPPVVWYAVAQWPGNKAEAAAALDPVTATLRLCEAVIDGGQCAHCHRPTIFLADANDAGPLDSMGCVYQWDPELATFRRSCEGNER
jgi:mono/diheme cytochrome c family protein